MEITPRPPQQEALKNALPALRKTGRALIVMATGLGKTIVAALIVNDLKKGPGVFLVHNNEILKRAMNDFRKVFGDKVKFSLYNGRSKESDGDIVFASFQTMQGKLKSFKRNQFAWMIVDEGHHAHAHTYRKVIKYFTCPRIALTATPNRTDMQDIRELFGDEVVNIPLEEAIARGWLPKIEYHLIADEGLDEDRLKQMTREVMKEGRRVSIGEINRLIFIHARDMKIAKIIEDYDEQTLIFCRNIAHAKNFKKFFKSAATYHSDNSEDENDQAIADLTDDSIQRVLVVNSFNEGIHIANIGLVAFNRSTDSETVFRQQLGRGLETGKDKLIVFDFVGNVERIILLKRMADKIAECHERFTTPEERIREGYVKDVFHLSGKGFEFTFTDKVVDLMTLIDRANVEFYPTWQEAGKAARTIGIDSQVKYKAKYSKDPCLPSGPSHVYPKFPGWGKFLGTGRRRSLPENMYKTWQEASQVAKSLGLKTCPQYKKGYRVDPLLPSRPDKTYSDFPSWCEFLGSEQRRIEKPYSTLKEAMEAARKSMRLLSRITMIDVIRIRDYLSHSTRSIKIFQV